MNDMQHQIDAWTDLCSMRLERIPSPFVWSPARPANVRVAVVGGDVWRAAATTQTLFTSGYDARLCASYAALLRELRTRPCSFDLVVFHAGRAGTVVPALELLRAKSAALPIVLITDDDPELLAEAQRFQVEEVLEPPVHPVALRAAIVAALSPPRGELSFNAPLGNI